MLVIVVGCAQPTSSDTEAEGEDSTGTAEEGLAITYEATWSEASDVQVVYTTEGGGNKTVAMDEATGSWEKMVEIQVEYVSKVQVLVTNYTETGTVAAKLYVGGVQVDTDSTSEGFDTAKAEYEF